MDDSAQFFICIEWFGSSIIASLIKECEIKIRITKFALADNHFSRRILAYNL